MKSLLLGLILNATFISLAAESKVSQRLLEEMAIEGIFSIHEGYDTNDQIELAVWGYLPNSCYRLAKSHAEVNLKSRVIELKVTAYTKTQAICLEMMTPFLEVVNVGFLPKGEYQVTSKFVPEKTDILKVNDAKEESQDDYLYAPVDFIDIARASGHKNRSILQLKGTYPALFIGCMRITAIETSFMPNNVLIVQPIASIFPKEECADVEAKSRRFDIITELEGSLSDKGLVHVRTPSGRSLNRFVIYSR